MRTSHGFRVMMSVGLAAGVAGCRIDAPLAPIPGAASPSKAAVSSPGALAVIAPSCGTHPPAAAGWPAPGPLRRDPKSSATATTAIVLVHGYQRGVDDCFEFSDLSGLHHSLTGEKYFRKLVPSIEAGFRTKAQILVFTWPTFDIFQLAGGQLASLLDSVATTGVTSVILLGHSAGGLVSRFAANELVAVYRRTGFVRGILTLATPHVGIPRAGGTILQWLSPNQGYTSIVAGLPPLQREPPIYAFGGQLTVSFPYTGCLGASGVAGVFYKVNCEYLISSWGSYSDGLVESWSALPGFAASGAIHPPFLGYDHNEMKDGDGNNGSALDPLYKTIQSDIALALLPPPPPPEFVTGLGGYPVSMVGSGSDLYYLGALAFTSATYLAKLSVPTNTWTTIFPQYSPELSANARQLRVSGAYLYWSAGGSSFNSYTIRRVPLGGGPYETVVDSQPAGFHYVVAKNFTYFAGGRSDGTTWVRRVANTGGTILDLVQIEPGSGFTVANGEVFYQDCARGALMALPVAGGSARQIATGLNLSNRCNEEMLVIGNQVYVTQFLGALGVIVSAPVAGGALTVRATSLWGARDLVSDGTYLFLRDGSVGEVIRFKVSNFARKRVAERSCGLLALDATHVYWSSEIAPTPAIPCLAWGGGPLVRRPKGF